MENRLIISFYLLVCLNFSISVQLPSSFRKCNRTQDDFNQCLATALQDALSQLTKPFPEVGLPSLDPLETPALTVPGGTSVLQFPQVYTNFNIYGLTNGNVTKFDFNFDNKTMYIEIIFPEIRAEFEYDYNGKILLVPIKGKGPGKISAFNITFFVTFQLEEYERDGKKYFKVVHSKVTKEPNRLKFELDNLVREDTLFGLGEIIDPNRLFNDNWRQIFVDVRGGYQDFQAETYGRIFNNLLEKVSISELFGDE